jgi:hypothetical protein
MVHRRHCEGAVKVDKAEAQLQGNGSGEAEEPYPRSELMLVENFR